MTKERKQGQERICDNRCNLWRGGERANYFHEQDVERGRQAAEGQTEKHKVVISVSAREGPLSLHLHTLTQPHAA